MTEDSKPQPIIVRRIKKAAHGHHGGAWKIAYADFVTAMMAFFLLMWLLGSTTKGDLQGIAEYFQTPLRVSLAGGSGSGDSSSVIQGGGTDLTRANGQVKRGEKPAEKKTINLQAAQALLEQQEAVRLAELKNKIDTAIDANPLLKQFKKQIRVDITPEGLRIQVVDEQNRPMFDSGSAVLKPYTRDILREIGKLLNDVPNRISLSGHTDANPYAAGERGYSNWELSADRANASRRELIAGGIDETKIIRVVGQGPAVMLEKDDPYSPINRRISIIVLNHRAEQRIIDNGAMTPTLDTAVPAKEPETVAPSVTAETSPVRQADAGAAPAAAVEPPIK